MTAFFNTVLICNESKSSYLLTSNMIFRLPVKTSITVSPPHAGVIHDHYAVLLARNKNTFLAIYV